MSQQSQSISLLEETDRQIREKSCAEQVRRLKEARNSYHEDLVDCVRHCVWYRATLFSPWKQRGMYATCMWVVELLLVLSDSKTIFQYVPEFYVESLVSLLFHLAFCFPPIHNESVYPRGSSFYYLCRLIVSMPCEGVTLLLFHLQYSSNKGWHHLSLWLSSTLTIRG
jgi:hypothetical protein